METTLLSWFSFSMLHLRSEFVSMCILFYRLRTLRECVQFAKPTRTFDVMPNLMYMRHSGIPISYIKKKGSLLLLDLQLSSDI